VIGRLPREHFPHDDRETVHSESEC
jgi:hypothetical protein